MKIGYNILSMFWRKNMSFLGLDTYELIKEQELNDIHSKGYVLRHKKSGARVALVSNDDDNKVFSIGFRTTPKDKTGLSIVDVKGKRFYPLVPEVSSIGHISALPESKNSLYRRTELEFCFRLSSEKEDFAYDDFIIENYQADPPIKYQLNVGL